MAAKLIDIQEIATRTLLNTQTIAKHRSGERTCARLEGFPDPYQNKPRLLWWDADFEAWADSRRTFRPAATAETVPTTPTPATLPIPKKRGPGRIPKAEGGK